MVSFARAGMAGRSLLRCILSPKDYYIIGLDRRITLAYRDRDRALARKLKRQGAGKEPIHVSDPGNVNPDRYLKDSR